MRIRYAHYSCSSIRSAPFLAKFGRPLATGGNFFHFGNSSNRGRRQEEEEEELDEIIVTAKRLPARDSFGGFLGGFWGGGFGPTSICFSAGCGSASGAPADGGEPRILEQTEGPDEEVWGFCQKGPNLLDLSFLTVTECMTKYLVGT